MSFRSRLTAFFGLIVILPMAVVAVLLVRTSGQLSDGRADAVLEQVLTTVTDSYASKQTQAEHRIRDLAKRQQLKMAWRRGPEVLRSYLAPEVKDGSLRSVVALDSSGRRVFALGANDGLATVRIRSAKSSEWNGKVSELLINAIGAQDFLDNVYPLVSQEMSLRRPGGVLATTLPPALPPLDHDTTTIHGRDIRIATTTLDRGGQTMRLSIGVYLGELSPLERKPVLALMLVALLSVAAALTFYLQRGMHGQIRGMLDAAKRIGEGDFTVRVPAEGRDELADLAGEFNQMSERLSEMVANLRRQRTELELAIRRVGEAAASGLDREALLGLILSTASEAVEARSAILIRADSEPLREGEPVSAAVESLLRSATKQAAKSSPAVLEGTEWHAIGQVLRSGEEVIGYVALARPGKPFDETEVEVVSYLSDQAGTSIENVELHDRVAHQAVTDQLTGLANMRRFESMLSKELERANRFDRQVCVLIADLDRFKLVNDTHGHQVGDKALIAAAKVFKANLRDVDEAARYGGEEIVVILPETDAERGAEVAERIRRAIADLRIELDNGEELSLTVSLGVAAYPEQAGTPDEIIAAADAALYRAKHEGRNLVRVAASR